MKKKLKKIMVNVPKGGRNIREIRKPHKVKLKKNVCLIYVNYKISNKIHKKQCFR